MKIDAKYGIIPIPELKYDICDIVKQINMTCPIAKGSHSISVSDTIPGEVPSVSTYYIVLCTYVPETAIITVSSTGSLHCEGYGC